MAATKIMRASLPLLLAAASVHTQQFKLIPGPTDSDGLPTSGAKVCLNGPLYTCYPMPNMDQDDVVYRFGLQPHAVAIAEPGPGPWLLFDATFSGGGSGTLTRYEIIRSEDTYLVGVMANVALTNQSDHAVWHDPRLSAFPLFITADFMSGKKETHFSRHHYKIHVYRYDASEREYFSVLSYTTTRRYPGLDTVDAISVIGPERASIRRRLLSLHPAP